jgi:hypothetical protein
MNELINGLLFKHEEHEVKYAQCYLGLYKSLKRPSKSVVSLDVLRKYRKVVHHQRDTRLLQCFIKGDSYWSQELYLLDVSSKMDVMSFIDEYGLSKSFVYPKESVYDCTGSAFGGIPQIKKLCNDRFVLRYEWNYDV